LTTFAELGLAEPLLQALEECGYSTPTPIQEQAIPPLMKGRDVLGVAQTGTGKTAAFSLPVLHHLLKNPSKPGLKSPRALILTPTRELAAQIGENMELYGKHTRLRSYVIYGGVGQNPQVRALNKGLDVLAACPGRLLDLQRQGYVDLSHVEFFVLDEADRMLDMGFVHDVRRVLKLLPKHRQNLLFSATMPQSIVELAGSFLKDPIMVEVTPQATTVERIDQKVMFVAKADKRRLLAWILTGDEVDQAIVFTRTKHGANRLVQQLEKAGVTAMAIHGNKSQNARNRALNAFRDGELKALVATDVASRGIDIDGVSHVFNFDLPNESESYVHRIGRTGRAGRTGKAIAFCDHGEGDYLRDIEQLIRQSIPVDTDHQWHAEDAVPAPASKPTRRPARRGSGKNRRGGRGGQPNRRRR